MTEQEKVMEVKAYRRLQMFLALAGFYDGPIDGIWGEQSKVAMLEAFDVFGVGDASEMARRMTPYLGVPTGKTFAEAWREAVQQAHGVGIPLNRIDRGYVWAIWQGVGQEWTDSLLKK